MSASVAYVFVDATANIYDPDAGSTYGTFESTWYGTGYFVNPDGWLVTNAHVAAPTQDDLMSAGANQPAAVAKRSHRLVEDGC